MSIYILRPRRTNLLATGVIGGVAFSMIFRIVTPVLHGDIQGSEATGRTIAAILILLLVSALVLSTLQGVNRIYLHDNGNLEFIRYLGTTHLSCREISKLDCRGHHEEDGNPFWTIKLHTINDRTIRLGQFRGFMDFVERICRQNPQIEVNGDTPMRSSPPWTPSARGQPPEHREQ